LNIVLDLSFFVLQGFTELQNGLVDLFVRENCDRKGMMEDDE